MPAIETVDLCKTYVSVKKQPGIVGSLKGLFSREKTEVQAVKNVSLRIEQGELVGFLGPNGAGKTTTIKMLTGILYPTSGEAKVLGYRPTDRNPEMLRKISLVMGNKMQLWWDLPAWDSFVVLRELYDVPHDLFKERVDFLVETLQISDKIQTQVRKLSLGERMKCELVAALLHRPSVVFLDEPTIGLDVVSQKRIRDFLRELHRQDGCTIILTSHYMQDVQELCKRVVVIDHGTMIFDGTLDSLSQRFSDSRRLRLSFSEEVQQADLERFGKVLSYEDSIAVLDIPRAEVAAVTGSVLNALPVSDIAVEDVDIDEVIRTLFERKG
ncbi:MAG TPA: ATP-binding cassette domain-containing protein [Fimbriimonadaceae bacterium]|nr:ATP-binding cassette domain-containing protein [Fimbriimonadaceae bacterium]